MTIVLDNDKPCLEIKILCMIKNKQNGYNLKLILFIFFRLSIAISSRTVFSTIPKSLCIFNVAIAFSNKSYKKIENTTIVWHCNVKHLKFDPVKTFRRYNASPLLVTSLTVRSRVPQEYMIVCVVSLEEINVTPDTVPYGQCREIRTAATVTSNMDRITIAASAAICGTVLIAVVVFIAASKRRAKKLRTLHSSVASCHPNKTAGPPAVGTLPVNCYGGGGGVPCNPSHMSSLAALNAFNGGGGGGHKDWDQGSMYSNRSLNPNRMYRVADSRQGKWPRQQRPRNTHVPRTAIALHV